MAIDYEKIKKIHKDSVRIVSSAGVVPDNSSFLYEDNNRPVKAGTPYHIHYTSDFQEYYMTGKKHFYASRIIKPTMFTGHSTFTKYTKLAGRNYQPLAAEIRKGVPKKSDYGNGVFTRYFAKNINDVEKPLYEVNSEFSSPLYEVIEVQWTLQGSRLVIKRANKQAVERAEQIQGFENISKLLTNPLEYFVEPELSEEQKLRESLGISNIFPDADGNIVIPEAGKAPIIMGLDEGPGEFKMKGPKKGGGIGKMKINKKAFAKYAKNSGGGGGGGY